MRGLTALECDSIKRYNDYVITINRPSFILKPKLSVDGNLWCALYGDNLMEGVAGFGDSPEEAYCDFDKAWFAKLSIRKPEIE